MTSASLDLDAIERRVAEAARAAELAAWRADVHGVRGGDDDADAPLLLLAQDAPLAARLQAYAAAGERRATMLAARLERVRLAAVHAFTPVLGDAASEAAWLAHLREDGVRARREAAWRARVVAAAPAASKLLACAAARRQVPDYGERLLAAHELDGGELGRLVAAEAARTEAAWRTARATRAAALGVDTLAPWDLHVWPGGASARAPLARALAAVSAWATLGRDAETLGFAGVNARVDEPAVGGAAATTYFVDAPLDVRVVAAEPRGEWSGWTSLAHELGHALYATGHMAAAPWSLRDAPAPWLHEAVAQVFAARAASAAWVHAALPDDLAEYLDEHAAFERLLGARLRLVHVTFERALLEPGYTPAQLAQLWWDAMQRHVGVGVDVPARAPSWARVSHFATRPGSAAVSLAADAAAARLEPALRAAGSSGAAWLCGALFAPGAARAAAVTLTDALAAAPVAG